MKKFLLFTAVAIAATLLVVGLVGCGQSQSNQNQSGEGVQFNTAAPKILVAYFSWGGNTRGIAQQIHERVGGDIFEIEPETPYSQDFETVVEIARGENERQDRPQLKSNVDDFAQYDIVILGFPNWIGSFPMPVATFLESHDLTGKKLIPFCSHGRGGLQNTIDDVTKLAQARGATQIGEPLGIPGAGDENLADVLTEWLARNLGEEAKIKIGNDAQ